MGEDAEHGKAGAEEKLGSRWGSSPNLLSELEPATSFLCCFSSPLLLLSGDVSLVGGWEAQSCVLFCFLQQFELVLRPLPTCFCLYILGVQQNFLLQVLQLLDSDVAASCVSGHTTPLQINTHHTHTMGGGTLRAQPLRHRGAPAVLRFLRAK